MKASWFRTGAILAGLCSLAAAQVPVVTITAAGSFPARTMEPCPVCLAPPAVLNVTRTGPTTDALTVHLAVSGTATAAVDYMALPASVTIPAGKPTQTVTVAALDDALQEGPEIVTVAVRGGTAVYNPGGADKIHVVIHDDEEDAPPERLDFSAPANGAVFASGVASIRLEALAVSVTREIDVPVEFFANGTKIGQSAPIQFGRPPIPGLPREHEFIWPHPANGSYTLTARTAVDANIWLEAPPIHITVGHADVRPVVSIAATSRFAEEDSAPTMRPMRFRGEFTVSRTGSTANAQNVYLVVSGTAAPGTDYTALPFLVTIPAGAASVKVPVDAIPDNLAEPLETVIAEVSNCPPGPILPPCYDFQIDPAHQRDTVLIRDDGITTASLEITAPTKGANFTTGQEIPIDVTALDADGGITRVDFYAGNTLIGTSELFFLIPPPPAQPVYHTFTWTHAPAGTHTLTARATAVSGGSVTSAPVTITVGGNRPPAVLLTSPANGAQIPSGQPVNFTVTATDPDGYTGTAEFYAGGHKLGEVTLHFLVPPPPGETQTYTFSWNHAPPGAHVLSARARDDDGAWGASPPVNIVVGAVDNLPVVTAHARDPFAVEPFGGHPANTASFLLRRHGPTAAALTVNYLMSGTATNGTDYAQLGIAATFAAGEATTTIVLTPLADNLVEGREKAVLQLVPQFDDGPTRYHVGARSKAIAIIADRAWVIAHPVNDGLSPLDGGHFHLRLPAPAAAAAQFRIEATTDLRTWETVQEAASMEDAMHFVDPDTPGLRSRFYRAAPDTTAGGP